MQLRAIEPQRLYQRVADQLAAMIQAGHWRADDRLPPERDLAATLNVSRPVVREAMVALELAGLVEVRSGSGCYVRRPQAGTQIGAVAGAEPAGPSPFELLEARRVIEGETAALAAATPTPTVLDALDAAIARMAADLDSGARDIGRDDDGDLTFHVAIARASGNATLENLVSQLWRGMRRPLFSLLSDRTRLPANARRALDQHRRIRAAIALGDPAAARTAMHDHIDDVARILMDDDAATGGGEGP